MINRIPYSSRDDIKKLVNSYVENGMWGVRIYAAACLGTTNKITICERNVRILSDIFRYSRNMGITDRDVLAKNLAASIIMRMEEMARYDY